MPQSYVNIGPHNTWLSLLILLPKLLLPTWKLFYLPMFWLAFGVWDLPWYLILSPIASFSPVEHFHTVARCLGRCLPSFALASLLGQGGFPPDSQPDWHLRLGCSGMDNACPLVFRLLGMLTPVLHCHASLIVLWFPE